MISAKELKQLAARKVRAGKSNAINEATERMISYYLKYLVTDPDYGELWLKALNDSGISKKDIGKYKLYD